MSDTVRRFTDRTAAADRCRSSRPTGLNFSKNLSVAFYLSALVFVKKLHNSFIFVACFP